MSAANRIIITILLVAAIAVGFWMLALGPKREKATELSAEVDALNVSLAQAESTVDAAAAARHAFPDDYRQLVVLGEAVPGGDETSSLLVELTEIANDSKVAFDSIQLSGGGGESPAPSGEAAGSESSGAPMPATEAAASLLPLGATIGPAGLGVMPYTLTFRGDFFAIADFISELDSLVGTGRTSVDVKGRLITIDGFTLNANESEEGATDELSASFSVTTYLTPPGQGITAGASPTEPPSTTTPASESGEEATESGEPVAAR